MVLSGPARCAAVVIAICLSGCADSSDPSHDVPRLTLATGAELGGDFTTVLGIHELSDGSVWVSDGSELSLTRVAVDQPPLDTIRRVGDGPLEYSWMIGTFDLPDDTVALYDGQGLLLIHDSEVVAAVGQPLGALIPQGGVVGMDARGGVLVSSLIVDPPVETSAGQLMRIRAKLQRSDRDLSFRDSIAVMTRPSVVQAPDRSNGTISSTYAEDARFEGLAYFADGALAVVRVDPYRVEWVSADGSTSTVGPLDLPAGFPTPPLRLGQTEPVAAPDGSVLVPIRTEGPYGDSIRVDVVSPDGRTGYFVLPPRHAVRAAGSSSIYIVATGELGLQTITRVPWPPSR